MSEDDRNRPLTASEEATQQEWIARRLAPKAVPNVQPPVDLKEERGRRKLKEIVARTEEIEVAPVGDLPAVVTPVTPATFLGQGVRLMVERMNLKHAMIGNIGQKCKVLDWVASEVDEEVLVPSFQSMQDFKNRYNDEWVQTDNGLKKRADVWLDHREKAKFDGVVFRPGDEWMIHRRRPGEMSTALLNLWRGWGVTPKPGDWSKLRYHIEHILAADDEEVSEYIKNWTAAGYQRPGVKRGVALVFRGKEGTGKGTFGHVVRKSYGAHGLYLCQPSQLTGRFNKHLWTVCFVFADEAFWAGDRAAEQILKSLVTDGLLMVEPKGVDAFQVPNLLDLILASNERWVVPVGEAGRRFAVFEVNPMYGMGQCSKEVRRAYFEALYAEIFNGGIEAMMWDLMQRDIAGWDPEAFPITNALAVQKQASLRGFDKAIESWAQTGVLPRSGDWDGRPDCATTAAMMEKVREVRGCEYETDAALKHHLKEEFGCDTTWRIPGVGRGGAKFPDLPTFREAFTKRYGGRWPWDESVTKWER